MKSERFTSEGRSLDVFQSLSFLFPVDKEVGDSNQYQQ